MQPISFPLVAFEELNKSFHFIPLLESLGAETMVTLSALRVIGLQQAVVPVETERAGTVTGSYSSPVSLPHVPRSTIQLTSTVLAPRSDLRKRKKEKESTYLTRVVD